MLIGNLKHDKAKWDSKYHSLEIKWITKIPSSSNVLVKNNIGRKAEAEYPNRLTSLIIMFNNNNKNICPKRS